VGRSDDRELIYVGDLSKAVTAACDSLWWEFSGVELNLGLERARSQLRPWTSEATYYANDGFR
jgi:hypothetical protein